MKNKNSLRLLVQGATIAALYAVLTYLSSFLGLAYSGVQFRVSEVLTILPLFTPAAIPGLAIGCLLGNIGSPFGLPDIILGTLASMIAAFITRSMRKINSRALPFLAFLPPIFLNAIIVGLEIAFFMPEGFSFAAFSLFAAQVAAGEAAVCFALGLPFYWILKKTPSISNLITADRE